MINSKVLLDKRFIAKKFQKLFLNNRFINMFISKFFVKALLIEENMIIRYIPLSTAKNPDIEKIIESYVQRNFINVEQLNFYYKIISLRRNEKTIILYCIRPNIEFQKLLSSHKKVKTIPFQEYIYKKVIRKFSNEEKILALYFGFEGSGIVDVIYKKHLIYTCNINDTHWDRIDEVIEDCFNQIKNIISAKNEDWTVILINNGIDKVKISYKNIKEMSLVRSC